MLWILILGLVLEAQGEIHCSGQKLTVETFCGETVTLPCQFSWAGLRPPSKYELAWQLNKNKNDIVVHNDDIASPANLLQSSMFTNRTYIQEGWDKHGNATLQIKDITERDQGVYTCDLLTPRPFDRKICTTITLVVHSFSNNCGTDRSLNASSGQSIQLPCLLRPACLPRTKREVTWRFTAFDAEREVDLHSAFTAGEQGRMFSFSRNGTLILRQLSTSDSGTYCCYLEGTEKCLGVHLRVSDVTVAKADPDTPLARMCLVILLPLAAIGILLVLLWRCKVREHLKCKSGRPSVPKGCKADERKDEDLDTNENQDSVTSKTGLLLARVKENFSWA